ncbi:amylo-alpha-1,6-glucosidase [Archangium sp.]|uniref:amylo-alpha-1,6-glucosidase n=1 Tax=Archangium sp. TaxID=1872627 RepID=UPI002D5496BD|nr:hypothetical protein [Archangium sp.]HYO56993.1 hypothetical protein [Archangium sp.]
MASRLEWMRQEVRALYERNRQRGFAPWADYEYDFVCPSMGTYPFQWFWDSCFHAVALSCVDVERARIELRSLLRNQQQDGFVAHVTFWQRERFEALLSTYKIAYRTPYLSDCMQPPLLAEAVDAIVRRGGGERSFLLEILPKLRRYYDWLHEWRDPDQDGLIAIIQPDETGLDHTPKFDEYLGITAAEMQQMNDAWERVCKPYDTHGRQPRRVFEQDLFIVEDVMVNTIYCLNLRLLARLHRSLGEEAGALELEARAARTFSSLIDKCYDPERGLFFDLAGRAERHLRVDTFTSLMPLVLPDLPQPIAERLIAHLEDPGAYAARFPVPTVSMREPSFHPGAPGQKLVWRGPSWINSNWYLARGLRAHGREELARSIEDRSVELIERSGFREYYNPHTGEGYGAEDFSWSALAVDMLASREGE